MTTETREVTVKKTIYISYDGQEFENEDDCLARERELDNLSLELYDINFKRCGLAECIYAKFNSEEELRKFLGICNSEGVTTAGISETWSGPCVYMYIDSWRHEDWINLTEVVHKLIPVAADALRLLDLKIFKKGEQR